MTNMERWKVLLIDCAGYNEADATKYAIELTTETYFGKLNGSGINTYKMSPYFTTKEEFRLAVLNKILHEKYDDSGGNLYAIVDVRNIDCENVEFCREQVEKAKQGLTSRWKNKEWVWEAISPHDITPLEQLAIETEMLDLMEAMPESGMFRALCPETYEFYIERGWNHEDIEEYWEIYVIDPHEIQYDDVEKFEQDRAKTDLDFATRIMMVKLTDGEFNSCR